MTSKTYTIASLARTMALHIGKETEYGVRPVVIDVSEWAERWPEMAVSVHVTRPGEDASYPAADVVREGDLITWTPNEIDTAVPGSSGTLELMGLMEGRKILSATVALVIGKTTTATTQDPPEGWSAWSDSVLLAAQDAAESAERAAASEQAAAEHDNQAQFAAKNANDTAASMQLQLSLAQEEIDAAKTAAADSASQAAGSQEAAASSAQAALDAADEAARAAQDAAGSRDEAAESAQAAKQDAGTAAQHAADAATNKDASEAAAARAEEVLGSLLEDYAALDAQVQKNTADILLRASAIVEEASGAMVTVDDAAAQPAVRLVSHIEPVQEGEGDPSPDNVRPISGWDKMTAQRTGHNLLDASKWVDYTAAGITFVNNGDGSIAVSGTNTAALVVNHRITIRVPLQPGTYFVSGGTLTLECYLVAAYKQGGAFRYAYGGNAFTVDAAQTVTIFVQVAAGATLDVVLWPQLEAGDAATAYKPYQGQTLTADLPETVYGGTPDWTTGLLTVNMIKHVLDGTETNISKYSAYTDGHVYQFSPSGYAAHSGVGMCTHYATASNYETLNTIYFGNSVNINTAQETVDDFKAYLAEQYAAGTPVEIVYRIAEPYTIQLTPQQLDLLKGRNHVWSDTGDTELTYVAETKLYIDKAVAAIAAAAINA